MIGAIAGDIIGSIYERDSIKTKEFPLFSENCRFTDDTVLTIAVAEHLISRTDYIDLFHQYYHRYPKAGFGKAFRNWAENRHRNSYQSWANGSAMRVSPVGFACRSLDETKTEAKKSAEVTHSHSEGIRGAQATAVAVFLARQKWEKSDIKTHIQTEYGYNLDETIDDLRQTYRFDVTCQGSVPQSIIAFLESDSYEDAVRNAISLGGDADTMACIAGGIAEAFYGRVPEDIKIKAMARLDEPMREIVDRFTTKFGEQLS
jgi:ADP-ribosylglycohydrolase